MAQQFAVKEKAVTAGAYRSLAPRSVSNAQFKSYDVHVTDDAVEIQPDTITELDVLPLAQLPTVNQSVFEFRDEAGVRKFQPWLICALKRAERDQGNRTLFRVSAEYQAPPLFSLTETDLRLITVPDAVTDYPFLIEIVWGENSRIIESEARPSVDRKPLRLPTNSPFDEPFYRRFPQQTVRQSQFEVIQADQIEATINARLFTVNDVAFRDDPAPTSPDLPSNLEPPRWLITNINYQRILAPVGQGSIYDQNTFLMTYTFERNPLPGGWWDRRALTDFYHLQVAGDVNTRTPYRDPYDQSTKILALIDSTGFLLPEAANGQFRDPEYGNWVVQPQGGTTVDDVAHPSWATFLKGLTP